jgi:hypothetical protein
MGRGDPAFATGCQPSVLISSLFDLFFNCTELEITRRTGRGEIQSKKQWALLRSGVEGVYW